MDDELDRVRLLEAKQDLISRYKHQPWFCSVGIGLVDGYPGVVLKVTPQAPIEDLQWLLSDVPFHFQVVLRPTESS